MHLSKTNDFFTGCNYWASKSGIYMWREWDEANVDADFRVLAEYGCGMLRVFPLWPDFQPLNWARGVGNSEGFALFRDGELPNPAGVDPVMVERLRTLCALAAKHRIRLIVGLVTGWMSGRCFAPPALEHLDHLNAPESIMWQVRMVRHLVRALRDCDVVAGWDLGNECNCLGRAENRFHAWGWSNAIAGAIRAEDPSRPVISGMHGLRMASDAVWRFADQAELTDVLTTHPYPLFTPYCNLAPLGTMRNNLHGVAESLWYAGVGGKPCFPEEAGSLGPGVASDRRAAQLLTGSLAAAWAHRLPGLLWWCAFRQNHLDYAPFNELAVERDLGLFSQDREAKPQAVALREFHRVIAELPALPMPETDVVVLLSADQDHWAVAFGCFILAKQIGFDIEFQDAESELRDAAHYWLPSLTGLRGISRRRYRALLEKVRMGATLFASGDGMLEPFSEVFGAELDYRIQTPIQWCVPECNIEMTLKTRQKLTLTHGKPLLCDASGEPALIRAKYGRGECWYCPAPLEEMTATTPGEVEDHPFFRLVARAFDAVLSRRMIRNDQPGIGITEHRVDAANALAVVINHTDRAQQVTLTLQDNWSIAAWLHGTPDLPSNGFAVLRLVHR